VVIEIDAPALDRLAAGARAALAAEVGSIFGSGPAAFAPYRTGSAFLVKRDDRTRHPA
jgi:hypothetical protein